MINLIPFAIAAEEQVDIKTVATEGDFFAFTCIANLISNVVSAALVIASLMFFIFLVQGGIEWATSGGDKVKVENAQKRITNALIGLVIVATSYAVYALVLYFLGIDLTNICTDNPIGPATGSPRPFSTPVPTNAIAI